MNHRQQLDNDRHAEDIRHDPQNENTQRAPPEDMLNISMMVPRC